MLLCRRALTFFYALDVLSFFSHLKRYYFLCCVMYFIAFSLDANFLPNGVLFFFVRLSILPEIFVRIYEILLYNFMLKDSLCQLDVTWLLNSIEWNSRHDAIEALIYLDMPMANESFYLNTLWWIQFNGNHTSLTISNFIIVLLIFWSWPFCQSMNCMKTFPLNSWSSEDEVWARGINDLFVKILLSYSEDVPFLSGAL